MNARQRLIEGLPVAERRLELAGIPSTLLEGGEGPPLVLLHGPGEHAAKWLRVLPALAQRFRVIAPDLPGHGGSAPPEDAARVLPWLGALIERCCARAPALVGQIIGGAIAARFAAEDNDRIEKLVLCDALGLAPFEPAPEFGAALMAFLAQPDEASHDRLWARCAFDLDALRRGMGERWEVLKAYNLEGARRAELRPAQQALMAQFGFPAIPAETLAQIRVPTALIWGRHDLATRLAVAEAAAARHGWALHVIEGAADDPPMEQPEAFVAALLAALGTESADKETRHARYA